MAVDSCENGALRKCWTTSLVLPTSHRAGVVSSVHSSSCGVFDVVKSVVSVPVVGSSLAVVAEDTSDEVYEVCEDMYGLASVPAGGSVSPASALVGSEMASGDDLYDLV